MYVHRLHCLLVLEDRQRCHLVFSEGLVSLLMQLNETRDLCQIRR